MLVRPAEEIFQKGLAALARGKGVEALALFEAAMDVERQLGFDEAQPRYVSFYGLCLALSGRRVHEGTKLCREALTAECFNPDLHLNLARALLAGDRKKEALAVLHQGLAWENRHPGLVREVRAMGRRRRPVLPFLPRRHPINVLLGRMTQPRRQQPAASAADQAVRANAGAGPG